MFRDMPTAAWVSIGIFWAGVIFTVIWWLIRRRVSRIDALEAAVFGTEGVRERLHKYVTHADLNQRLQDLTVQMGGISEEGQKREERILAAIERQTLLVGSEVREIKTDLRAQAVRIDAVFADKYSR